MSRCRGDAVAPGRGNPFVPAVALPTAGSPVVVWTLLGAGVS